MLETNQYDVIHFEFSGLAISYQDAIKKLNAKTVVSCRGTAEKVKPLTDVNRKKKLTTLFEQVSAIHCVSNDMAETIQLYGADAKKIFVNTPAIDSTVFEKE